jgi:NADPH:quinone reductase-like Zn-dependent oxidoreductase
VKRLRPGDAVFGACEGGTCAEYACVAGDRLARKPAQLSFEEAAALPTSGVAALHALRDVAQVRAGQRVLINGAAGGVGSYALQLAKAYGAHVTAVCSGANASYVRALGADRVIDYTTEDFTHGEQRYDVILDNVENRSLTECRRALAERGTLVLNSGTGVTGLAMAVRLLAPVVLSPFTRQNLRRYLSMPKHDDLVAISDLVTSGAVKPVIEQVCTLEETAAALAKIEGGHVRGKIVVRV